MRAIYVNESQTSAYEKFMLEYNIYVDGKWQGLITVLAKTLNEIYEYMDEENISMEKNDYSLKGWQNGKWVSIISKLK